MSFTVFMPTKWIFGSGAFNELRNQSLPGKKAMIVVSNGKSVYKGKRLSGPHDRTAGVSECGICCF